MTGDLTIKGVTKPVTVDFEYTGTAATPSATSRVGFEGTTTVNRKDWGVNWNAALEAGGVLVSEKVTLEFEVSATRTPDQHTGPSSTGTPGRGWPNRHPDRPGGPETRSPSRS